MPPSLSLTAIHEEHPAPEQLTAIEVAASELETLRIFSNSYDLSSSLPGCDRHGMILSKCDTRRRKSSGYDDSILTSSPRQTADPKDARKFRRCNSAVPLGIPEFRYDLKENASCGSELQFPAGCLELLRCIPGNEYCIDCGQADPQWASVSYGILLCLRCSGRHRGLGVQISFVRSISMDGWSHSQVLSMLEGGNNQLSEFFKRHSLTPESERIDWIDPIVDKRYRTKAAMFYRENLALHVQRVISDGVYRGREAARKTRGRKVKKEGSRGCYRRSRSEVSQNRSTDLVDNSEANCVKDDIAIKSPLSKCREAL